MAWPVLSIVCFNCSETLMGFINGKEINVNVYASFSEIIKFLLGVTVRTVRRVVRVKGCAYK